jgi:hypothetical protein
MKVSAVMLKQEGQWRAEQDLDTLICAKKIKADKKRMQAVRALAQKRLTTLASFSFDEAEEEANE